MTIAQPRGGPGGAVARIGRKASFWLATVALLFALTACGGGGGGDGGGNNTTTATCLTWGQGNWGEADWCP